MEMMWWQAIVLGIVEGVTEYLPVSSTGHLILAQRAMGLGTGGEQDKHLADAYAICIQSGAIVAVASLYWNRVVQMFKGVLGKDAEGLQLAINIIVAFLPAAVIGMAFNDAIEAHLFGLWPVVAAWFVGGAAILAVAWYRRVEDKQAKPGSDMMSMTWKMALIIGLAQCIAMWPGTSRSLVTIVAGVLLGMRLAAAVEFSFLLGVLTLLGATFKKAVLDDITITIDGVTREVMMAEGMLATYGWTSTVLGFVFAFISAVIAVKWMVAYLKKHGLEIFGYWRVGLALIVAGLIVGNVLEA